MVSMVLEGGHGTFDRSVFRNPKQGACQTLDRDWSRPAAPAQEKGVSTVGAGLRGARTSKNLRTARMHREVFARGGRRFLGYFRFFWKKSRVRFHARSAEALSYRGVVSLLKPCCAPA